MLAGLVLGASAAAGQTVPGDGATPSGTKAEPEDRGSDAAPTSFELDFPGGSPGQLVRALEKAAGRSFNIIVSPEASAVKLPPIHLTVVVVAPPPQSSSRSDELRQKIGAALISTRLQPGGTCARK